MLKISFLNPPFLERYSRTQRSPAVTKSGTLYFPMWLASAAGFAEASGHQIDLIDAPAAGLDQAQTIGRLVQFAPTLLVVETSTPSIHSDRAFCAEVKEALPNLFVVLVGTHVSALPEPSLQGANAVDAVAIGEYDQTIMNLASALESGQPLEQVAGIGYRDGAAIHITEARAPIEDLDRLPMVSTIYQRFLDIRDYFNPNALHPMVTIVTSRGCPNQCSFCVYPQTLTGHRLRTRSARNVVDEIEYIQREFPDARSVFFEDDTFSAHKRHCQSICDELIRRRVRLPWSANVRVDVDPETLEVMHRAGCRNVCVGFESGDQRLLDAIHKQITLEQSRRFMRQARALGLIVHGCFIVGLPGETRESMERTLAFAIELQPDTAQFYPIMVYPGTAAYDWYDRHDLLVTRDFSRWLTPSGLHNTVIRTPELSEAELVAFCDQARRRFYLRPRYLLHRLRRSLTDRDEFRRSYRAGKTFIKYLVAGSDIAK